MALDNETKSKVVFYLGYPGKVLIAGSTHYNSIVVSRLTNLDSFIEDQVEELLTQIEAARTKLIGTQSKGNVKRIGDIEFDTDRGNSFIQSEYKRFLMELSSLLDIPLKKKGSRTVCMVGP